MLYLLNSNIVPGEAVVRVTETTADEARSIIQSHSGSFTSAIGHESTAQAFSEIIGAHIPVNRINAAPAPGDVVLSLKLNGRLPEGQVLGLQELKKIGFSLWKMEFFSTELVIVPVEHSTSSINY